MKHVAVIGAGPAGLASAKSLAEVGVESTVFERAFELGGIWRSAVGPTWLTMRTNLSRFSCMFSDFPHAANTEDFPSVPAMHSYLESYAEFFGLRPRIELESRIKNVRRHGDSWQLLGENKAGRKFERQFDGLVIASGFFSRAQNPELPGIDRYQGRVIHSSSYAHSGQFADKRVVVLGGGMSGVEIAADIAKEAAAVVHLIRRPFWVLPRYVSTDESGQCPLDLALYRRKPSDAEPVPAEEARRRRNEFLSRLSGQNSYEIPELKIHPNCSDLVPVAVSDTYLELVKNGEIEITLNPGIDRLESAGAVLNDGRFLRADAIICCTGYQFELPFLPPEITALIQYDPKDQLQPTILYQGMLHRELPNLAFVGAYKGPYFGIIELQARLAARVLEKGDGPPTERYASEIETEVSIRNGSPRPQFPHADYVGFADSLAAEVGCLPELEQSDRLFKDVTTGPVIPPHFRLSGEHSNRAIAENVINDLNTRFFPKS